MRDYLKHNFWGGTMERALIVLSIAIGLSVIALPVFAITPPAVPEPSSAALFGAGGIGVAVVYAINRWIRRK
jgi:hypothetical protein